MERGKLEWNEKDTCVGVEKVNLLNSLMIVHVANCDREINTMQRRSMGVQPETDIFAPKQDQNA